MFKLLTPVIRCVHKYQSLNFTKTFSSTSFFTAARKQLVVPTFVSVANLANKLNIRYTQLSKTLIDLGFDRTQIASDYLLDKETAALIAQEFGFEIIIKNNDEKESKPISKVNEKNLKPRPPVVAIMGHVDHGKTTILDHLRKSSIVKSEHGGITQHIGAFSVTTPISKKQITFLDTPGHSAFLKMRERGANITDIVILVVAADDSVKPQTLEAIKHCDKYRSNVIVAINKCDKPDANPSKVLNDLSANGIYTEQYGGDIQAVEVSGLTGLNMDKLEEEIITLAEVLELKAEKTGVPVKGHIIESQVKKGAGNSASVLVTQGTLKVGSILVAGSTWGKVKSMKNEFQKNVKNVAPGFPVEVFGWKELPNAGDSVLEVKKESSAKQFVAERNMKIQEEKSLNELEDLNKSRIQQKLQLEKQEKLKELLKYGLSVEDLKKKELELEDQYSEETTNENGIREIPFIVKSDVSGSAEAVVESVSNIGNDEIKPTILYSEVGSPTESDLERAKITKDATIICFNVPVSKDILLKAEKNGVKVLNFNIIYNLIEEVTNILSSHLKPLTEKTVLGTANIKQVFEITNPKNKRKFKIAGSRVINGTVTRNSKVLVMRNNLVIYKGTVDGIKQAKDEAESVRKGSECGIQFDNWEDFEAGDVIETYEEKEVPRHL